MSKILKKGIAIAKNICYTFVINFTRNAIIYNFEVLMNFLLNPDASNSVTRFSELWSSIGNAFSSFDFWKDAVDILLLSVLFFCMFRFVRGKKGAALMLGMGICLFAWFVSFQLELDGVYFIFSKVFEIGIIALIIIFQPELRDVLERIGSGPLNSILNFGDQKKKQQLYYKAVDAICAAISDLSRTKTGALIVLSRNTALDDVINTGVSINADVNSFLLRNLFFNKAPLHDGAVVIDEARIVSAGCLLPLTRRQDMDGDLGTRHRAAVGMSEVSDAIIVVVSEETGVISVASGCTLTRNYTPDTLRSLLLKAWVKDKSESYTAAPSDSYYEKKVLGIRLGTYLIGLLSLICAVIFWLYVKIVPTAVMTAGLSLLSRFIV